jgi:hypothetical protein
MGGAPPEPLLLERTLIMFAASKLTTRRIIVAASAVAALVAARAGQAFPSTEAQHLGPVSTLRNVAATSTEQPPAKLIVDPPQVEALARGVAIVQFRTENLQIVPVFGPAAAKVTPRIGHLHVTLDDAPWHWGHTSNDPIIVAPLPPGPHTILIELADADHKILAKEVVKFELPQR